MRVHFFLVSFLCVINFCCRNSKGKLQQNLANSSRDTIEIDIPRNKDGSESNVCKYVKQMSDKLSLERLDSGYVPFQIRIWYHYGLVDSNQLFLVKHENDKWVADWYTISFSAGSSNSDTAISIAKKVNPKHGWVTFINALFELKIDELPDIDKLPGITDYIITEPTGVVIEFSAINRYRLYSYYGLSDFRNKWWQATYMDDILRLIEDEFDFKRLYK